MGLVRFSELLSARLDEWYGEIDQIEAWGDPAGNARASTDERTCFEIVRKYVDIPCKAAPTNEPTIRREAVAGAPVEFATASWIEWFNNRRILTPIGDVPPAEHEDTYHAQQRVKQLIGNQ